MVLLILRLKSGVPRKIPERVLPTHFEICRYSGLKWKVRNQSRCLGTSFWRTSRSRFYCHVISLLWKTRTLFPVGRTVDLFRNEIMIQITVAWSWFCWKEVNKVERTAKSGDGKGRRTRSAIQFRKLYLPAERKEDTFQLDAEDRKAIEDLHCLQINEWIKWANVDRKLYLLATNFWPPLEPRKEEEADVVMFVVCAIEAQSCWTDKELIAGFSWDLGLKDQVLASWYMQLHQHSLI